jgi:hypothetical protein
MRLGAWKCDIKPDLAQGLVNLLFLNDTVTVMSTTVNL